MSSADLEPVFEFVVTTSRGIDELLLEELRTICPELTFNNRPGQALFEGTINDAYQICLWSRLANRVLLKVSEGKIDSAEDLYNIVSKVQWSTHFSLEQTFVVDFKGTNRTINNTQFGSLKIKDAIVDQFSELFEQRPSVSKTSPDIRIQGRVHNETASIYIDLSGKSLHQRYYRQHTGQAPLKEHLACAMLMRSGWTKTPEKALFDPMCGSGTIVIEAAMMAANIAPGLKRQEWGFTNWLQHDPTLWQSLLEKAQNSQVIPKGPIFGNDNDKRVLNHAKQNADSANVFNFITFFNSDATKLQIDTAPGIMVSNPPYGERLSELTELLPVFQSWGAHLKEHFVGWNMSLLTSNRDIFRQLKFVAKKQYKLMNGPIECVLVNYQLDEKNCEVRSLEHVGGDFSNRLTKNLKKLERWVKQQNTDCYRIYDADLPEYNVAIDKYADWLVVQEYAAPKDVPEQKARKRLHEVLISLPAVTGVPASNIVVKTRKQQKGASQYEKVDQRKQQLVVNENGAKFIVNLRDYLDTGLFLDHRIIRQKIQRLAKNKTVLNLFAYTGSATVHAGLGGARSVTTVDMSKTYIDWAKENVQLNDLKGAYEFVQADCLTWIARHTQQYDLIFIDPPSFSNSKRMTETWDVQRDYLTLLANAHKCLSSDGIIVFSNNLRSFKLDNQAVEALGMVVNDITQDTIPEDYKRNAKIHHCWILNKS